MRIRYHFLVDLHITRHVLQTESEKRIWNTLNEPCGVELIILQAKVIIIDPQPYWSTHFFIYHREFTNGFVQGKPDIDECFRIRRIRTL